VLGETVYAKIRLKSESSPKKAKIGEQLKAGRGQAASDLNVSYNSPFYNLLYIYIYIYIIKIYTSEYDILYK
jgi:hypothetical protein